MTKLADILADEKIICKTLKEIKLNTKKRLKVFVGVNLKNEYCLIVFIERKSRFLTKDVEFLESLKFNVNFKYKKKILILLSPICSKAKKLLSDWRVILK